MPQEFEDLPLDDLADVLRQFYGTVLNKNGKEYSRSGLINLRSGLNRHLHAPPHKKNFDLMNDKLFTQANLVFTGRMRDNKEKGLDTSTPRTPMDQADVERLFNEYFPKTVGDNLDTEVLLHKVFFDIMYYTGRRGKEGLRNLTKESFQVKTAADGKKFIEITFNEKTKKNQGDSMSTGVNALHNDHHVITEIKNSPLCPVESYKRYLDLLNPAISAFFQHPSKNKKGFNKEAIGKKTLGVMMKEVSEKAKLSRIYTNHQIRKTTATGLRRSGFTLEQIAHVTKHKNLDSLKHYVDGPTLSDKENYNEGLFNYANPQPKVPQENNNDNSELQPKKQKIQELQEITEDISQGKNNNANNNNNNNRAVAIPSEKDQTAALDVRNVINNQLRQAPNLFQNASFNNCNFTFTLPQ